VPAVADRSPTRPTPDRIALKGLRAQGHHGVYAFERERGQTFRCDAVLELDTSAAAAGDDLRKTVNYADLARELYAVLAGDPVNLLEALAQRLADVCLANPLVDAVEITVHKPQAELGVPFDDVTVSIRRQKDPSLPTMEGPSSPLPSQARGSLGRGPMGPGDGPTSG
jgi:7,8-dihydroneopterin aldolase/epimerase/oxygenase